MAALSEETAVTLYHFIGSTWDLGGRTGISRFDGYLRLVFPEMMTVGAVPVDLDASQDVIITDNQLSLRVPVSVSTIVVHHGCSRTLYEREIAEKDISVRASFQKWRKTTFPGAILCCSASDSTRGSDEGYSTPFALVDNTRSGEVAHAQDYMFNLPNRTYVAPSLWVKNEFVRYYNLPQDYATVIPHWVPLIDRDLDKRAGDKPVIIGDWRDENKGKSLIPLLHQHCPDLMFKPLSFISEWQKLVAYQEADLYLGLSRSEGFCYSMADAEAVRLKIVTTPVGGWNLFDVAAVLPISARQDVDLIAYLVRKTLACTWHDPSFYEKYTLKEWSNRWHAVVEKARQGAPALK